jgi:hypothetical protein
MTVFNPNHPITAIIVIHSSWHIHRAKLIIVNEFMQAFTFHLDLFFNQLYPFTDMFYQHLQFNVLAEYDKPNWNVVHNVFY